MRSLNRSNGVLLALMASTAVASPAQAQEASILPFPVRTYADENGVDLLSGLYTAYSPAIRIGSEEMGLGYVREVRGPVFRDPTMGSITFDEVNTYTVDIAGKSEAFILSGSTFTPVEQNGSSLTLNGSTYTYTRSDGTVATFAAATYLFGNAMGTSIATLTYPSGRSLTYHYVTATYLDTSGNPVMGRRLQSVTTNAGYHMKLSYQLDTVTSSSDAVSWARIAKVKGLNSATDSCAVTDFSCPQTGRPELTIPPFTLVSGTLTQTYVDSEGQTTTYTLTGPLGQKTVTGIKLPGSAADNIFITYVGGRVSSITRFGVTTNYNASDAGNVRTVTVTRTGGATRVITFDTAKNVMLTDRNELNRTTSYQYDTNNRVTRITHPEGNYTQLTYDARGNVTQSRQVAKSGSGLADIVASASFDATCTNPVKCNRPNSATDPRGNTTNYIYDTTHGGLVKATAPAPTTGATRPETRISYTRLDSSGSPSGTGIFRPTAISTCQIGSAPNCVGTVDEVKTSIVYGQGLLPANVSKGAGDNSLTATSSMTYDVVGNLTTVDGPLAGTADTTKYRYNGARQVIGVVGPDPDGGSSLKHRALRTTYINGFKTKIENGTVNGQSDADWTAFAPAEVVDIAYDSNARASSQKLSASGTAYALTQVSYDALGRLECTATRMNPAAYGSLPGSACSLGTQGSFGADRIGRLVYDSAGQVSQKKIAVGTTAEAIDQTLTYTNNGQLATLKDAENNLTTYEYDGHDRLSKTRYPNPTKGAGTSSTTDYELLSHDAAGNITNRRLRDAQNIAYTYDNLGRATLKNLPGSEPDVTYGYDNLGRLTALSQTGNALSFTYDALGRNLAQAGPQGTVTSAYDLAGRRTRLTYPGSGLYVDYDYLVTGDVTKIHENGATSGIGVLATYAYDDLGRTTSLTYGNGTSQSFAYDAVSRLTSLTANLAGTTNDLTINGIGYNPAGGITGLTRSNDTYAWTGATTVNRPYTSNGLNQLTLSGTIVPTYDARGNLTSAGTTTYAYSAENMLTSASGGTSASLAYDPGLRLYQVTSGATTMRFAYDGLSMIAEYDGSNALLRRYVHGPGMDQPLVWYEGSGTATRRFLHADERGSVIAVSDASGNSFAKNSYDEYGIPGSGNVGRFQYTGQAWLPELGMYHYKNRIYSPTLGRFLQTDPIGYGDGMNMYGYVKNDPVNFTDPLGLIQCTGSKLNRDDCGTSPDPVTCMGSCGHWATVMTKSKVRYTEELGGSLEACVSDVNACIPRAAFSSQSIGPNGTYVPGTYSATLGQIVNDPDVRSAIKSAWIQSNPFGPLGSKNEHGFWIGQVGRDYYAGPMIIGSGAQTPMDPRLPGSRIFFHTHPFSPGEGYDPWFSSNDLTLVGQYGIMMIVVANIGNSGAVIYEFDFRR